MRHKLGFLGFSVIGVSLLFGSMSGAHADDAAIEGVGGTISLMAGHPTVRMVSELVKVKLPTAKVSALFIFRNDGPATWVTLGFPEQSTDFEQQGADAPLTTMHDFRSSVDNKLVTVTRYENKLSNPPESQYTVWWVKRIHFAAGQTRKVHDTYTGGLAYLDPDGNVGFHYVLKSGDSWHGPIGKATIIVDTAGLVNHGPLYYQPYDGKRSLSKIEWIYHDFNPHKDIVVAWMNPFAAVSVDGKPVWHAPGHGLTNIGTAQVPELELDPFVFGWPADKWGGLGARRIGDDVIVSAKTASAWLDAAMTIGENGYISRFSRDGVVAPITPNRGDIVAWGGGKQISDRIGRSPKPLFELAQYFNGDSSPETRGYTAIYLRKLVSALGGTSRWDNRLNRLFIEFPHAVGSVDDSQTDAIDSPAPDAQPMPVAPVIVHHNPGM